MTEPEACERVADLRRFYGHLLSYVGINGAFVVGALLAGGSEYLVGPLLVALFWGSGLAVHATRALRGTVFWSRRWEERKIQELMHRDAASPTAADLTRALSQALTDRDPGQGDDRMLRRLENLEAIVTSEDWTTPRLGESGGAILELDIEHDPPPGEHTATRATRTRA